MRMWYVFLFLAGLALFGCDNGKRQAGVPGQVPYDCYAYGTCAQNFGVAPGGVGNFNPYQIGYGQNPYQNGGFTGCNYGEYPVYYPNYGYACINNAAFQVGFNYSTYGYQPSSYQFLAGNGYTFPSYYDYNNSFAFQGCVYGQSSCGCQNLTGVPSQFGVCAYFGNNAWSFP